MFRFNQIMASNHPEVRYFPQTFQNTKVNLKKKRFSVKIARKNNPGI